MACGPSSFSRIGALAAVACLASVACSTSGGADRHDGPPTPTGSASSAPPPAVTRRVLVDLVEQLPRCDLEHRGLLLDLGTDAIIGRYAWARGEPTSVKRVEHDGGTWARFEERRAQLTFTLLEPTPIFVAARAEGYAAKSASILLDDQPLGTLPLAREQIRVTQTGTTNLPLDPGLHMLTLRFQGHPRDADAFADLDWLRVGFPDDGAELYSPPTLSDSVAPATALGGVPHRSIAIHAKGAVRCSVRVPNGVRLRTAVGLDGPGEASAEVRLLHDGKPPVTLASVAIGGDKRVWQDLDLPLPPDPGGVTTLELRATTAPKGTRVLFGDPAVVLDPVTAPPLPTARVAIVVVLDGVERAELPPWLRSDPSATLPSLGDLAQHSVVFERHRAPSTLVSASFASILTGLAPSAHGLTDASARLPAGTVTVGSAARDASVRAVLFTGVPHSFRAFGFASGWERFEEQSPSSGAAATGPIDDATAWINEISKGPPDARHLIVVHARGGHPPWDVAAKELANLEPHDYGGLIEPRRAAETLARMRHAKKAKIVSDADRQRVRALEGIALTGQDRAIGALVAAVRAAGLWESTLFIVTGDVASGSSQLFGDGLELSEPVLTLPLYVHFPGNLAAGRRVAEPTDAMDLAPTLLRALGVPSPKDLRGRDLARLTLDLDAVVDAPQIATLDDRYSARLGDLVLSGRFPKAPSLCDLALDVTCAFDRRDSMPLATMALFRAVVASDVAARRAGVKREPATLDDDTAAALRVWGDDP